MTQEQYNRAVEISDKLRRMKVLRLNEKNMRLSYMFGCTEVDTKAISSILNRHDKMIREEIYNEIEKLKKEIEEL